MVSAKTSRQIIRRARIGRILEELRGGRVLHQLTQQKECDRIGDTRRLLHIVRNDHERAGLFELAGQLLHHQRRHRVECRGRLVHQQNVGLHGKCAGDAQALLLSTRKTQARLVELVLMAERPGYLRLYGQESLNSCYNVSLVARRQQDRYVQVETCVEFAPTCREQMAGLAYMYDTGNFYLLVKTREEEFGSQTLDLKKPAKLRLIKSDHFDVEDVIPAISIPEEGFVYLRVNTTQEGLYAKFFYSLDGKDYQELAEVPTNILTDEQSDGFTGAHFGMYCHDMTGGRRYADFDYFEIVKTRKEQ